MGPTGSGAPSLPIKTLGGAQLWDDVRFRAGFRAQRNVLTGHHRLIDARDVRRAFGSLEHCIEVLDRLRPAAGVRVSEGHLVVLLHGLGRTARSMRPLARHLERGGLSTAPLTYASTRGPLEEHVASLVSVLRHLEGVERVSFVTHSLGGIVVRAAFARRAEWESVVRPHRMVMLAPPNRGSRFAAKLDGPLFRALLGESGAQVAQGLPQTLPVPPVPFGVIAGGSEDPKGKNVFIEGDDDGVVAVEETRLEGASDHRVVPSIHTFIMNDPEVATATLHFLVADVPRFSS